MKNLSSAEIRQMYLDFFAEKGHKIEPSAPLVPVNDPTLLWINSGVATMKQYFDGSVVPENPRMTSSQKSIRTNDIENVGKTARHHTLFEMLGNFSVGDYFKPEAINWAWEFLTSPKWLAFDPDKLYVTVYPKDTEAHRIWRDEVGLPESHIVEVEDNFWDIGEGPSGPDSEIFYDRGQAFNNVADDDPENYPGGENERYLEIWNIVFSEFNHTKSGEYEPLPHKNIDTGMGLERVVSVIQGAKTNFETDLFLPIIHATEKMTKGIKYGDDAQTDISFKVIADHTRAVTFAIGDGALPSNEGRGYVLRRLIRRATMHGQKLGVEKAFLYELVPVVGEIMVSYYPEVLAQKDFIAKVIRSEEERFHETLSEGLDLLNSMITEVKANGKKVLAGEAAFKLSDTYGFPVELTKEYANDEGIDVDEAGFKAEMEQQRARARAARTDKKSMGSQNPALLEIKTPSQFIGYHDCYEAAGNLLDIVEGQKLVDTISQGEAQLIFDQTPFYAEMGGQVADQGVIIDKNGDAVAEVIDVQHAPNGQNLHTVKVLGKLEKNVAYTLKIDVPFRKKVMKNHSATHLLDQALRDVLGAQAHHAGSLVAPTYLRFDFTHFGQVTPAELAEMERIVNEKIWAALPVITKETDVETAKKMGAIALFGEKYGKVVRVVKIGDYSMELCGGTHVENTADIGLFKIIAESGIGAGVRRIEAVTSEEAYQFLNHQNETLQATTAILKVQKDDEVPTKVASLQSELKETQRELDNLSAKLTKQQAGNIFDNTEQIGDYSIIAKSVAVKDMGQLRQFADDWKNKAASDILVLGAVMGEKVNLIAAINEKGNSAGLKAGDLIKEIAPIVGGGGGGRPDMAQAGGKNPAGLADALKQAKKWVKEH